jgi:two-component system, cell cycle response regulator
MLPLILLVDDEEDILEFLARVLCKKYSILTAENGQEALDILNNEAVQLIISDVMMPVMDGFEFCKTVKSNFEYCHIPIILLTAKNTIQSKVDGLELGADAYIEKPFSKEHLQAQIASLLSNRNMIREYFASSPLVHLKSIAHSKTDERFLETLNETIYKNIEDADLDVEKLAKIMNMSRPTLFRKIKAISNMTPNELITLSRLKKAAELLSDGQYKIYEVSDLIGYNHQSNFTRDFHKQFKMTPTEYVNSKVSGRSLKV